MKRLKRIGITLIVLICVIGLISAYFINQNWLYRYKAELDQFFGEGKWEYVSNESKRSTAFKEYTHGNRNSISREFPGEYNNWYIQFNNRYGEEENWYISDHILKINHDRYGFFSAKRLSSRQAFYLELMDIALNILLFM